MISTEQYEALESKMEEWETTYKDRPTNLWYFAGLAVIIALIILAYILGTKSKLRKENQHSV